MGMRRLIASMCFLWRIGASGSVFIASVNSLVSSPFLSWANRSKVDVLSLLIHGVRSLSNKLSTLE